MSSSSSAMSSNWISSSSPGPNVSVSLILAADETENASEKSHEYSRRPQSESNNVTGSDCAVIDALNALYHHQGAVWKWDCHHFSTLHTSCLWFISGETLNCYFERLCMANRVALTLPLLFSCSWSGHHHGAATLLSPKIQYVCDVQWGPLLIKTCNYFPAWICKKTEYYFTYRSDTLMFVEVHGSKADTRQQNKQTKNKQQKPASLMWHVQRNSPCSGSSPYAFKLRASSALYLRMTSALLSWNRSWGWSLCYWSQ